MSLRRVFALAALVLVMGPSVQVVADLTRADAHGCTDGMCRCTHARPAAPAAPACHGSETSTPDCSLSARCAHQDPAVPGTLPPALIPEARTLARDDGPAAAPVALTGVVRTGYTRIDSPPPRPA